MMATCLSPDGSPLQMNSACRGSGPLLSVAQRPGPVWVARKRNQRAQVRTLVLAAAETLPHNAPRTGHSAVSFYEPALAS